MKSRLLISFSGGRTSAYMTWSLLSAPDAEARDIAIVFANTGREDDRTLAFVDQCDRLLFAPLGRRIAYIEAVVNPGRKGSTHRVVNFETLERRADGGAIFESVIAKYGIPNRTYPHCNRELKLNPIHDYARAALKWESGSYETAIGIRADEADRQNSKAGELGLVYPLIRRGITKAHILQWWRKQAFDLSLPEHEGNCVECWKKSTRKHLTLISDRASTFDFFAKMEREHPFSGAQPDPANPQPRRFFRGNWTTLDLAARARMPFERFIDDNHSIDAQGLDLPGDCSESCDIYAGSSDDIGGEQVMLFGDRE